MKFTRRNFVVAGLAGAALAHTALDAYAKSEAKADVAHARLKPPLLGNESAPKRLVVWGGYTCPFTAQMFVVLKGIVSDHKEIVSVEWRHFPTHPPDPALHVAGLAFEGEHFWGFTFRVLTEIYRAGGHYQGLTPEKLSEFAIAEGGSAETLRAAYRDRAKWRAVQEDLMAGRLLGVTRTPGLFHNGYFMTADGIPMDLKAFDKALRAMLQAA